MRREFKKLIWEFYQKSYLGIFEFFKLRMGVMAAAASFYSIIGLFPLMLLFLNLMGLFISDLNWARSEVLMLIQEYFPQIPSPILAQLKKIMISGIQMKGPGFLNFLGIAMLFWSSMGSYRATMMGMTYISKQNLKGSGGIQYVLRSLLGVLLTFSFLSTLILWAPLSRFLLNLLKNNFLVNFIKDLLGTFSLTQGVIEAIFQKMEAVLLYLNHSTFFPLALSFGFLMLLYAVLITKKLRWKDYFFGAVNFAILYTLGKHLFWVYLEHVKADFIYRYGQFYTLIMVVLWIYFILSIFFVGACSCFVKPKKLKS